MIKVHGHLVESIIIKFKDGSVQMFDEYRIKELKIKGDYTR